MVRNQKIHIDANPAVACIRRARPARSHSSAREHRLMRQPAFLAFALSFEATVRYDQTPDRPRIQNKPGDRIPIAPTNRCALAVLRHQDSAPEPDPDPSVPPYQRLRPDEDRHGGSGM